MRNTAFGDDQRVKISKTMVGLMQALEKLAPHPNKPNYKGALFVALPGWCRTPGAQDGMMGGILMSSFLGAAFGDAASDATSGVSDSINLNATLEAYDCYRGEVEGKIQKIAAHGQGTLARMSGVSLAKGFNMRSSLTQAMQDFFQDMPERMKIEGQLAHCLKQYNSLGLETTPASLPKIAA